MCHTPSLLTVEEVQKLGTGPPCGGEVVIGYTLVIVPDPEDGYDSNGSDQDDRRVWRVLATTTADPDRQGWLYSVMRDPDDPSRWIRGLAKQRFIVDAIEVGQIIRLRRGNCAIDSARLQELLDEIHLPDKMLCEREQHWCLDLLYRLEREGVLQDGQAVYLEDMADERGPHLSEPFPYSE